MLSSPVLMTSIDEASRPSIRLRRMPGLSFQPVQNPYRANNDGSLSRINVALDDLYRRSGRQLHIGQATM